MQSDDMHRLIAKLQAQTVAGVMATTTAVLSIIACAAGVAKLNVILLVLVWPVAIVTYVFVWALSSVPSPKEPDALWQKAYEEIPGSLSWLMAALALSGPLLLHLAAFFFFNPRARLQEFGSWMIASWLFTGLAHAILLYHAVKAPKLMLTVPGSQADVLATRAAVRTTAASFFPAGFLIIPVLLTGATALVIVPLAFFWMRCTLQHTLMQLENSAPQKMAARNRADLWKKTYDSLSLMHAVTTSKRARLEAIKWLAAHHGFHSGLQTKVESSLLNTVRLGEVRVASEAFGACFSEGTNIPLASVLGALARRNSADLHRIIRTVRWHFPNDSRVGHAAQCALDAHNTRLNKRGSLALVSLEKGGLSMTSSGALSEVKG